jgi:gamma-glutamylcysteine synthetase
MLYLIYYLNIPLFSLTILNPFQIDQVCEKQAINFNVFIHFMILCDKSSMLHTKLLPQTVHTNNTLLQIPQ